MWVDRFYDYDFHFPTVSGHRSRQLRRGRQASGGQQPRKHWAQPLPKIQPSRPSPSLPTRRDETHVSYEILASSFSRFFSLATKTGKKVEIQGGSPVGNQSNAHLGGRASGRTCLVFALSGTRAHGRQQQEEEEGHGHRSPLGMRLGLKAGHPLESEGVGSTAGPTSSEKPWMKHVTLT